MKLREIATRLGCALISSRTECDEIEIRGVMGMDAAQSDQITFLANPKYAHKVKDTRAAAIIVHESVGELPIPALLSMNPYLDFARALELFYQAPRPAA